MRACAWRSTIWVDGKDMRGATKSTDHHPAAVMAEADVLHLEWLEKRYEYKLNIISSFGKESKI